MYTACMLLATVWENFGDFSRSDVSERERGKNIYLACLSSKQNSIAIPASCKPQARGEREKSFLQCLRGKLVGSLVSDYFERRLIEFWGHLIFFMYDDRLSEKILCWSVKSRQHYIDL